MASSPQFKVYSPHGQYLAACKYPEDAAAIIALHGDGAQIRWGHKFIVWDEGKETCPAGESFDLVSGTVWDRVNSRMSASALKREG